MKIIPRQHQQEAYNATVSSIKRNHGLTTGRIVIPTGGGKTLIEAMIIEHQMNKNRKHGVTLVISPRIMLSNQLAKDIRGFITSREYLGLAFHSGKHEPDYTKVKWSEKSTTSEQVVIDEIARASRMGKDLVIFSTYHSSYKLKGIDFDTIIADESQYCVAEEFHKSIVELNGRVKLFFTATEKFTASETGRGLNNTNVYGERIYEIEPAVLIDRGIIVAPRLHIMYSDIPNTTDVRGKERDDVEQQTIVSKVIALASEQHKLTAPELGFSKILFALNGTNDVKTVMDNIDKIHDILPDHDICTVTSKHGECINGVQCRSRTDFLNQIKIDGRNCLIFHYDILSEGIDVDGITGVCILRNMGLAKMIQTIGRAVRVYKPDPSKKKQAWISVSVVNGDTDGREIVREYVHAIRKAGYPINIENVKETNWKSLHAKDQNQIEDAYHTDTDNRSLWWLQDIFHEIETNDFFDDMAQLSSHKKTQAFNMFLSLFDEIAPEPTNPITPSFDNFLDMF